MLFCTTTPLTFGLPYMILKEGFFYPHDPPRSAPALVHHSVSETGAG